MRHRTHSWAGEGGCRHIALRLHDHHRELLQHRHQTVHRRAGLRGRLRFHLSTSPGESSIVSVPSGWDHAVVQKITLERGVISRWSSNPRARPGRAPARVPRGGRSRPAGLGSRGRGRPLGRLPELHLPLSMAGVLAGSNGPPTPGLVTRHRAAERVISRLPLGVGP